MLYYTKKLLIYQAFKRLTEIFKYSGVDPLELYLRVVSRVLYLNSILLFFLLYKKIYGCIYTIYLFLYTGGNVMSKTNYRTYGFMFDINKFKDIQNNGGWNKPIGGLWSCKLINNITPWLDFITENPELMRDTNTYFDFNIKDNARILKLYDTEDYDNMMAKYSYEDFFNKNIDFEAIAKDFDMIDFKVRNLYFELMGWDLDSVLILNKNVIDYSE